MRRFVCARRSGGAKDDDHDDDDDDDDRQVIVRSFEQPLVRDWRWRRRTPTCMHAPQRQRSDALLK